MVSSSSTSTCPLTPTQRVVLLHLAQGVKVKDIATALVLSPETIKTHLRHILERTGANTNCQAVYVAAKEGWI